MPVRSGSKSGCIIQASRSGANRSEDNSPACWAEVKGLIWAEGREHENTTSNTAHTTVEEKELRTRPGITILPKFMAMR